MIIFQLLLNSYRQLFQVQLVSLQPWLYQSHSPSWKIFDLAKSPKRCHHQATVQNSSGGEEWGERGRGGVVLLVVVRHPTGGGLAHLITGSHGKSSGCLPTQGPTQTSLLTTQRGTSSKGSTLSQLSIVKHWPQMTRTGSSSRHRNIFITAIRKTKTLACDISRTDSNQIPFSTPTQENGACVIECLSRLSGIWSLESCIDLWMEPKKGG